MPAIDAVHRGASGAGIALVAGLPAGVAEIGASRALQDVAAQRRHIPDLLAGGELQRLRQNRRVTVDLMIVRNLGHGCEGAQVYLARRDFDASETMTQIVDVDE